MTEVTVLAALGTGEALTFWVLAPLCVLAALGMVIVRNAVHAALFLAAVMLCLAGMYAAQQAPFLAAVQVIVYTGAILMLFLFVLMLIGVDSSDSLVETLRGQRVAAVLVGLGFAGVLIGTIGSAVSGDGEGLHQANEEGNVVGIARLLFTKYVFAFEVTSALLITAALGAMVLAHRPKIGQLSQREQSRRRFIEGRPAPLPGPGVFAETDAVGTPALLPSGEAAPESVVDMLDPAEPREEQP
ncbi:MAG TPA: NADH-quinone oxidoreductase subunit J [Mycobacteriales bacterium]|nr:NADH-quinone oxidoreductase subunit J [Mycobacteriales bacterium]